jgi:NAD+ synthase (glutamine-hydrolysing)
MPTLRVALAQINTTIGDMDANVRKAVEWARRARDAGADVVSFPELTVTGYPPEDLLLRSGFVEENLEALGVLVTACRGITVVVGFVDREGEAIYNAAAVIDDGSLAYVYRKQRLPNYGVFDEKRYFSSGAENPVLALAGVGVGVNVCEDIWFPGDPTQAQAAGGAQVIVNINGSPYHAGKVHTRQEMLAQRARDYGVWVCYTNQVGGQDELVFDGGSMVINPDGELVARAAMFEEELLVCDIGVEDAPRSYGTRAWREIGKYENDPSIKRLTLSTAPGDAGKPPMEPRVAPTPSYEGEVYSALVLATRDYLRKTGFEKALIALSGGIDSTLVAAVAVDAIGAENVVGVSMPSRYSSEGSIRDAKALAENLGVPLLVIPIEAAHASYLEMLERPFAQMGYTEPGVAEENVQSRIRGNLIMALSNRLGYIVLTTGNKSEFATGYATLYGDMSGGYAVIKDVPKTLVYSVSRYRNTLGARAVIPESVLTKPPSAELKPGQLDQDTLPPYDVLDPIIDAFVEDNKSGDEIVAMGFERATVERIVQMIIRNEYKRRQAPPGVKITPRAFGRDWRLPIAHRYRGT